MDSEFGVDDAVGPMYTRLLDFQIALDLHRQLNGENFDFATREDPDFIEVLNETNEEDGGARDAPGLVSPAIFGAPLDGTIPHNDNYRIVYNENIYLASELYNKHRNETGECQFCFGEDLLLRDRWCCSVAICDDCLRQYIQLAVRDARVKLECPSNDCHHIIQESEMLAYLDREAREKYRKFVIDSEGRPDRKTCPKCGWVTRINEGVLLLKKLLKYGLRVQCHRCLLVWCFLCQSPWHKGGVRCIIPLDGDLLLKQWAYKKHDSRRNAVQCPKCRTWIEKASGCDHIKCKICSKDFCYKCKGSWMTVHECKPFVDKGAISVSENVAIQALKRPLRRLRGHLNQKKLQKLLHRDPKNDNYDERKSLTKRKLDQNLQRTNRTDVRTRYNLDSYSVMSHTSSDMPLDLVDGPVQYSRLSLSLSVLY